MTHGSFTTSNGRAPHGKGPGDQTMTDANRARKPQTRPQMNQAELEAYFLLIQEAETKHERNEIRRECFQVIGDNTKRLPDL